jgi:hypothetical protein
MAFRIDGVGIAAGRWYCLLKGVRTDNAFGLLMTGPQGKGLQLANEVITTPGKFLLPPEEFCLPLHVTYDEAVKRFEETLRRLGWELDASGD